jgi:hypothetical protein
LFRLLDLQRLRLSNKLRLGFSTLQERLERGSAHEAFLVAFVVCWGLLGGHCSLLLILILMKSFEEFFLVALPFLLILLFFAFRVLFVEIECYREFLSLHH